jgi:deoxyadenosine/deoxycytidine kinase
MGDNNAPNGPHIVIVGPCASGKSTLSARLRERGYDAAVCSQEHSEIATLWRHSQPDVLIALDIDLAAIRARRGREWPETIYRVQIERLKSARAAADVIIDATKLSAEEVLNVALNFLRSRKLSLADQTGSK